MGSAGYPYISAQDTCGRHLRELIHRLSAHSSVRPGTRRASGEYSIHCRCRSGLAQYQRSVAVVEYLRNVVVSVVIKFNSSVDCAVDQSPIRCRFCNTYNAAGDYQRSLRENVGPAFESPSAASRPFPSRRPSLLRFRAGPSGLGCKTGRRRSVLRRDPPLSVRRRDSGVRKYVRRGVPVSLARCPSGRSGEKGTPHLPPQILHV